MPSGIHDKPALVIGQMSGTSLDGIDLAACLFHEAGGRWHHEVVAAETIPYTDEWSEQLLKAPQLNGWELARLDREYGHYLGETIQRFAARLDLKPLLISTHGHTVFHRPEKRVTLQIGSGSAIATETGLPVVCDFRSADVAMGGQGAPLVPIGDKLLFGDYEACLNLGGFGNISFDRDGMRIAFDICPVNIILNKLAALRGMKYDHDGRLARGGNENNRLMEQLNKLPYYDQPPPKSLGREWLEHSFLPLLQSSSLSTEDLARTVSGHIAFQVGKALKGHSASRVLVTGGGAHNGFLVDLIRRDRDHEFMIPPDELVDFKEAIIFAFLGLLRYRGEVNILGSVTGCPADHSAGALHLP